MNCPILTPPPSKKWKGDKTRVNFFFCFPLPFISLTIPSTILFSFFFFPSLPHKHKHTWKKDMSTIPPT